jgi:hypothetical protein
MIPLFLHLLSLCTFAVIDTPDPYVQITVPGTVGETIKTEAFYNNIQPDWKETFVYHVHPNTRPSIGKQMDYSFNSLTTGNIL